MVMAFFLNCHDSQLQTLFSATNRLHGNTHIPRSHSRYGIFPKQRLLKARDRQLSLSGALSPSRSSFSQLPELCLVMPRLLLPLYTQFSPPHSSMRLYTATKFYTPGLIKSMAFGFREASAGCALIPQIFTQCFVFSVTQEHTFYIICWRAFAKLASISGPMFILTKQSSCQ